MISFKARISDKTLSYLFFALPVVATAYFSYQWRYYQLDDALIYMRYIKNFQEGYGLVYNPGEKFNGLTSPLFTFIMIGISFFTKNLQAASIGASSFFLAITSIVAGRLFSTTIYGAVLTALVFASFRYFYTTFGMETTLFLMLISISLYLYKIESDYFIISLALLVSTRSEGIFLAAPMTAHYVFQNRKLPGTIPLIISLGIVATPFIFNYVYYGAVLPSSASAKFAQGKSGFWGKGWIFLNAGYFLPWVFSGSKFSVYSLLSFACIGALIKLRDKIGSLSILFSLLLLAFYVGFNLPNYHWYFAPFFFFTLLFASVAVEAIMLKLLLNGWRSKRALFAPALVIIILAFYGRTFAIQGEGRQEKYAVIGNWVKQNTSQNATLALVEIGTVGWYADRYIVDILGLVNQYNAAYIGQRDLFSWLKHYQPDYILKHVPRWEQEDSFRYLEKAGAYTPVADFNLPGYMLLKRETGFTNNQITAIALNVKESREHLNTMLETSTSNNPFTRVEDDKLITHAPSTFHLIMSKPDNLVGFSYGIRKRVVGLQHQVCFDISLETTQAVLFHKCIDNRVDPKNFLEHDAIKVQTDTGTKLKFSTSCMASCNFGWSYWSEITIK